MNDMVKKEQNERKTGRYGFAGRIALAAACMAVVVAAGAVTGPLKNILGHSETGSEDALLTAVDEIDKLFTLQVKAADSEDGKTIPLAEGNPIPVTMKDNKTGSWMFGADDVEGSVVNYCINIPQIVCEGGQIDSITYSINNGAFQIVQPENGESLITDGQLYEGELNTGSIGGDYNEEREGLPSEPFETLFYQSFTLDYDRQSDEHTWINICNERPDSKEIVQLMLDNTVITCTVNYQDGTSQSVDIKVDSHIMTRREAGQPLDEGIDPEEKMTVITFELQ